MKRRDALKLFGLAGTCAVLTPAAVVKFQKAKYDLSKLKVTQDMRVADFPKKYNALLNVVEQLVNVADDFEMIEFKAGRDDE